MGNRVIFEMRAVTVIAAIAVAAMFVLQLPLETEGQDSSTDITWNETTLLSGDRYQNADIEIGKRHIYVMTWEFYTGPVIMLQRSDCWGMKWSAPTNVFGEGMWNSFPGMCCYTNGTQDELLIVAGPDSVAKSSDSGDSFEMQTPLPIPYGCEDWRYMAVGTNASWFGGPVDPDIYVIGSLYVGSYWTGTHMLAFTKSTDWGLTWSDPVFLCPTEVMQTNYPEIISDGSRLYVGYTKINVSLEGSELALKWSDDWGASWSEEIPIPLARPLGLAVTGFQYVDEDRAIMTVSSNSHDPIECTGKIGYFYFSNCTYQVLCEMSGPEWCIAAGTFAGELAKNGVYHIAWAQEPVLGQAMNFKYAWSKDVPFTEMDWKTPIMMGNPSANPGQTGTYGVSLYGTESDSGQGEWELRSNGDWLQEMIEDDGSCEVTGTPTAVGEFWVNLTVSDDDSSDYFNWTVSVTQVFPDDSGDDPVDDPTDEPADDSGDESIDDSDDGSGDDSIDEDTDESIDDSADEPADTNGKVAYWLIEGVAVACGAAVVAVILLQRRRR